MSGPETGSLNGQALARIGDSPTKRLLLSGLGIRLRHLQRRMEIYESLNPVAKHGGNPGKGTGGGKGKAKRSKSDDSSSLDAVESFTDNTARKLGTSPRQVQAGQSNNPLASLDPFP